MIATMMVNCPHCGRQLTGHTGNGGKPPKQGDLALCWNCQRLGVIMLCPAGFLLRPATPQEAEQAVRSGIITDLAVAMRDSSGPVEAGMRFEQLKRQRETTA